MPSLRIYRNFTTRPFGGDDLHIACLILGIYRLAQFICLAPLCIHHYISIIRGDNIWVNDTPPWCGRYDAHDVFLLYVEELDHYNLSYSGGDELKSFTRNNFGIIYVFFAARYMFLDVGWLAMTWSAASLGTPTETKERDRYLR